MPTNSMDAQLRQLAQRLQGAKTKIEQVAAKTLANHAERVAEDAKTLAPVDTGELRDSIDVVKTDELHYEVTATAPYAIDVELGTAHQAAQPFLHPAYEANRTSLQASLAQALKSA